MAEGIADDTGTRIGIKKAEVILKMKDLLNQESRKWNWNKVCFLQVAANDVVITITGKREGIKQATFIMSKIVKSNLHKLNQNSMSLSYKDVKTAKPKKAGVTVE